MLSQKLEPGFHKRVEVTVLDSEDKYLAGLVAEELDTLDERILGVQEVASGFERIALRDEFTVQGLGNGTLYFQHCGNGDNLVTSAGFVDFINGRWVDFLDTDLRLPNIYQDYRHTALPKGMRRPPSIIGEWVYDKEFDIINFPKSPHEDYGSGSTLAILQMIAPFHEIAHYIYVHNANIFQKAIVVAQSFIRYRFKRTDYPGSPIEMATMRFSVKAIDRLREQCVEITRNSDFHKIEEVIFYHLHW